MYVKLLAGMFGSQSASEFCFTLSNGVVSASSKFDIKYVSLSAAVSVYVCYSESKLSATT